MMMGSTHVQALLGTLLLCMLQACGTARRPAPSPLPYHVAIAPLRSVEVNETQGPDNMRFELGPEKLKRLNTRLLEVLSARSFAKVTGLPPSSISDSPSSPKQSSLLKARKFTNADLLLTLDLRYGTAIYHEVSASRIKNAPFWWVPGPQFWLSEDHTYGVDLTMTVNLYDMAINSTKQEDRPPSLRRWFFTHAVSLDDVSLNFFARAGGRFWPYVYALVTPSTLLARQGEELEARLTEIFIERLADTVADELQRNRDRLNANRHDFSFHLVTTNLQVQRSTPTRARVRFSLDLRSGRSRNQPVALRLFPGDAKQVPALIHLNQAELSEAYEATQPTEGYVRYSFVREVLVPEDCTTLRLHVAAGNAFAAVREFTLRLPDYRPSNSPLMP